MIDKLFVLSIGGSGARAARAFTHLCAMGLGPKKVKFFFIDLDINNGDFLLTRDTINSYRKIRENLDGSSNFFKTDIELATVSPWSPLTGLNLENNSLGSFLNYLNIPDAYSDTIQLLFSKDELSFSLDVGCRAHPNIGSFLISAVFQDDNFRDELKKTLEESNSGVYLFHSIFGGTGAAGGPVIIKGINERFGDTQNQHGTSLPKRPIGASVLFPYFIVPEPKSDSESIKIKSETFDFNAAAALPFYRNFVPADHIYILGDREKSVLKKYCPGSREQVNPAHYLELFAGLMGIHFCNSDIAATGTPRFFNPVIGNSDENDYSVYFADISEKISSKKFPLVDRIKIFEYATTFYNYFYHQSREQKLRDYVWLADVFRGNRDGLDANEFSLLKDYFDYYHDWINEMHKNHPSAKLFNLKDTRDIRVLDSNSMKEIKNLDDVYKYYNIADKDGKSELEAIVTKLFNGTKNITNKYSIIGGENA